MNLLVNGLLAIGSLMILQSFCEASASTGRFKDALHPDKCVIKPDLIRSTGQTTKFQFYDCARIVCGKRSIAHIHTCGVQSAARGCKLSNPIYPQADYPICCIRQSICDSNKSTTDS